MAPNNILPVSSNRKNGQDNHVEYYWFLRGLQIAMAEGSRADWKSEKGGFDFFVASFRTAQNSNLA
jgi:hypothetical protein